ncbi:hypothetical protein IWZ01DRAFT_337570 [Phyllosticta capitalensis]
MPLDQDFDDKKVVITGAGGEYGLLTVTKLLARGVRPSSLILVTDKPQTIMDSFAARGCDVRCGRSNSSVDELAATFAGGQTLLLIPDTGGSRTEQEHKTICAALRAGIQHIVFISIIGAERDQPTAFVARDSKAVEQRLFHESMRWTILRDSQYSETMSDSVGLHALRTRMCMCNIGDGRIGFVSREDSAACAAAILENPELHHRRTYHLTGPETLRLRDVLDMLEDLEGLERGAIRHEVVCDDRMVESLESSGVPKEQAVGGDGHIGLFNSLDMVSFGRACRLGEMAMMTDDVALLTGRKPQSMREVLLRRRPWKNDSAWGIEDVELGLSRSCI